MFASAAPARLVLVSALALASLSAFACGGPVPPKTGVNESLGGSSGDDGSANGAPNGAAVAPRGPRKPSCEGGTCSPCGEGICPNGFYCEVASKGRAPGCAWLPACGDKPSCACLTKAAPGCTCEERGGAPFLSCN